MWPLNGLARVVCSACAASVANPLRMSVTPAASQTCAVIGTGIIPTGRGSADPQTVPTASLDLDLTIGDGMPLGVAPDRTDNLDWQEPRQIRAPGPQTRDPPTS